MKDLEFQRKVTVEHLAKWAYVYIRQSSPGQVVKNTTSTELQYLLVERAVQLGWPRDRIRVIDEDLGKSGKSAEYREGFQYLLAEVGLAHVGLVVSRDASRLARNNRDWYQLVDLCAVFGTLLADTDSVYDPRLYHDRLLLGLSGMMSEAELHQLKLRLTAGLQHKAEQGTLRLPLPAGLVRQPDGQVEFNPDAEVQTRLRLVFAKFKEFGVAKAVVRYLLREGLRLPMRRLRGSAPQPVEWAPASETAIVRILKNPAYAGTYAYGQSVLDATRRQPGQPRSGVHTVPMDQWRVLIHDVYPAYISWEEFLANQAQLTKNNGNAQADHPGVPRKGHALLQGIVHCGRCGSFMAVHYKGPKGEYPYYECATLQQQQAGARCQGAGAALIDAEVEQQILAALAPDQVAIAVATVEQLEQEYETLRQQWQHRLERARYETERAQRQYSAVEPENRLVARTLERDWELKLRATEQLEQEYQTWVSQHRLNLTDADREALLRLASDFAGLWQAPTTTVAERKQLIRLVIKEVIVDTKRLPGETWLQINWQTGATSEHHFPRHVATYSDYAHLEKLQRRIRELHAAAQTDGEIAATLNAEGFVTARGRAFSRCSVRELRCSLGLPSVRSREVSAQWEDGTYSISGAAVIIGTSRSKIYRWLKRGLLEGQRDARGLHWRISLTKRQIEELKALARRDQRHEMRAS